MFGIALPNSQTLYAAGTTSTGPANNGTGKLVVTDISNPAQISVVATVPVPLTKDLYQPLIQGNLAVALCDDGGYRGVFSPADGIAYTGHIVVTTFDIANVRQPVVLASVVTSYQPGAGGGSAQIGTNLFLFGGVRDSAGNNVLLLVDTTNRLSPFVRSYPVPAAITRMVVAGNVLHTSAGAAGYAA